MTTVSPGLVELSTIWASAPLPISTPGKSMVNTGFLDSRDMEIGPDGGIEIILSKNEQPGNWLPMTDETNQVNVRQTFQDRANEKRAELKLERIGAEGERPQPFSRRNWCVGWRALPDSCAIQPGCSKTGPESMLPLENTPTSRRPGLLPDDRRRPNHPLLPQLLEPGG